MNLRFLYLIKQTIAHNQQGFNSLLAKWELSYIFKYSREMLFIM